MDGTDRPAAREIRVLMVAPTPFFSDRGCHVRILEEARAVIRRGCRVTVCTYHLGRDVEECRVRRSPRIPWYRKLSAGPSPHKFYVDPLLAVTTLRACAAERPDVIHAHLHEGIAVGWLASRLYRVPMVADLQGSLTGELLQHGFFRQGSLSHRFFRTVERGLLRLPSAFLLSSPRAISGFYGSPRELGVPNCTLHDGVDTDSFYPARPGELLRDRLGLPSKRKIVGYLGVLSDYQGIPMLLETARLVLQSMPDVQFLVMGYPNVERYRRAAVEMGIADRVRFPGRIPYDQARDYLAACDIGVSAKQVVSEANVKLLNYMAVGIPVVATDTPINREMLGAMGLYAPTNDPAAMARSLVALLSDDDRARDLGRRLRDHAVKEFSWTSRGDRIVELYEELLRSGRRGAGAAGS